MRKVLGKVFDFSWICMGVIALYVLDGLFWSFIGYAVTFVLFTRSSYVSRRLLAWLPDDPKHTNAAEEELERQAVFCTSCGKELGDQYKFCIDCGAAIERDPSLDLEKNGNLSQQNECATLHYFQPREFEGFRLCLVCHRHGEIFLWSVQNATV